MISIGNSGQENLRDQIYRQSCLSAASPNLHLGYNVSFFFQIWPANWYFLPSIRSTDHDEDRTAINPEVQPKSEDLQY